MTPASGNQPSGEGAAGQRANVNFSSNTYSGPWSFQAYSQGGPIVYSDVYPKGVQTGPLTLAQWQSVWGQDVSSAGGAGTTTTLSATTAAADDHPAAADDHPAAADDHPAAADDHPAAADDHPAAAAGHHRSAADHHRSAADDYPAADHHPPAPSPRPPSPVVDLRAQPRRCRLGITKALVR
jgi:hypothetical protein